MTQEDKIGVAIIGVSGVGKQHAKAFLDIKEVELVGVWGTDQSRTKDFANNFNIKSYKSLEELLADKKVQIVDIVGVHNKHAFFGIAAAKEGKHVIVEKPLDASLEAAQDLVNECLNNNVYLTTVFQHRYDKTILNLKKAVDSGELGQIFGANIVLSRSRSQEYYDSNGGWRGNNELSGGGVLINQAIHMIDKLVFLFGEATSVYGETEIFNHSIEVEDVGVGLVRFKNNVLATINAATAGLINVPESLEVHGTLGSARIEGETLTYFKTEKLRFVKLKNKIKTKLFGRLPFIFTTKKKLKSGYHKENLSEIIKAIKRGKRPPVSFNEGLKSLEIVKALMESAKTKKTVNIRPAAKTTFGKYYLETYLDEARTKKPKVLIINPLNETKSNVAFSHIGQHRLRQPLGLAYTSSFLKQITTVQLVDAAILGWDNKKTIEYINQMQPEILIVASCELDRWQNPDLDISGVFKIINESKAAKKILIGTHGSVTPDWIFKNCQVDFVVRGEPEMTCFEIIKNLLQGSSDFEGIAGLSWKKGNEIIHNKNRTFDTNLDEYPLPDYGSLPMHLYRYTTDDLPGSFSIMLTSRGCPGQCVFCLKKMMPDKYRVRSAESVYDEMKYLYDNFAINSVYFQDWEFVINKERVKKFCDLLIKNPDLNMRWGCSARASSLDPEIVSMMKKAGCVLINFGFESGSQEILNTSKKGVSLEKVKEVVELCRKEGINIRPFCLANLPGETKKTLKESAKFIVANNLDIPHINTPIPYPGTKMSEIINSNSWEQALSYSGKVQTTLDPEMARKLLRKYIWQGKFGILYFFNPKFWQYSFGILRKKFLI